MKRERPLILSVIFWSAATSAPCVILAQSGRPVPAAPQGAGASIQPAQELAPGAIGPASVPPADSPIDQLLVNLEGQDPEKGTLAARDFLARAADEKSPNRNEYLTYLRQSLDPGRISAGGAPLRAAERLIGALGYTAESGQPLPPEGVEMVLCLVGAGPESFHKVVRDAIYSFARAETRGGTRDAAGESVRDRIVAALGGMLQVESPPPPGVREEIFGILWSLNGKELLRSLISALPRSRSGPGEPLNPYLVELRRRTALGFSSPDEWLRWWEANQGSSIEQILDGAHRQFRAQGPAPELGVPRPELPEIPRPTSAPSPTPSNSTPLPSCNWPRSRRWRDCATACAKASWRRRAPPPGNHARRRTPRAVWPCCSGSSTRRPPPFLLPARGPRERPPRSPPRRK